jgi:hypothetical protein
MNRAQKRIIGWALIVIGTMMVLGVVVNAYSSSTIGRLDKTTEDILNKYGLGGGQKPGKYSNFDLQGLFVNPLFYLGVALGVGGVVALKGDTKTDKSSM